MYPPDAHLLACPGLQRLKVHQNREGDSKTDLILNLVGLSSRLGQIRGGANSRSRMGPGLPTSSSYELEHNGIICRVDITLIIVIAFFCSDPLPSPYGLLLETNRGGSPRRMRGKPCGAATVLEEKL